MKDTSARAMLDEAPPKRRSTRGTTNRNDRGSAEDRRRRREWLVETYRADRKLVRIEFKDGRVLHGHDVLDCIEWAMELSGAVSAERVPACRCYRCGLLLAVDNVTVDRIIPGCKGGTYRRDNIRPACGPCNSETGGALRSNPAKKAS